MDIRWGY